MPSLLPKRHTIYTHTLYTHNIHTQYMQYICSYLFLPPHTHAHTAKVDWRREDLTRVPAAAVSISLFVFSASASASSSLSSLASSLLHIALDGEVGQRTRTRPFAWRRRRREEAAETLVQSDYGPRSTRQRTVHDVAEGHPLYWELVQVMLVSCLAGEGKRLLGPGSHLQLAPLGPPRRLSQGLVRKEERGCPSAIYARTLTVVRVLGMSTCTKQTRKASGWFRMRPPRGLLSLSLSSYSMPLVFLSPVTLLCLALIGWGPVSSSLLHAPFRQCLLSVDR